MLAKIEGEDGQPDDWFPGTISKVMSSEEGLAYTVRWHEHAADDESETEGFTADYLAAPGSRPAIPSPTTAADTPLSNALQKGHKKCAALLRAAGAKDVR